MKKLFTLAFALVMILSLAACGGTSVSLVDVNTDQGISLKLPSDMTVQTNLSYANTKTSDIATFASGDTDPANFLTKLSQEDFVASELSDRTDLKIISFQNDKKISGNDSLVCKFSFTSAQGTALTGAIIIIDGASKEYIISLLYLSSNANGSLAKNLDACIDSIAVKAE